jgi:hypothetical protein
MRRPAPDQPTAKRSKKDKKGAPDRDAASAALAASGPEHLARCRRRRGGGPRVGRGQVRVPRGRAAAGGLPELPGDLQHAQVGARAGGGAWQPGALLLRAAPPPPPTSPAPASPGAGARCRERSAIKEVREVLLPYLRRQQAAQAKAQQPAGQAAQQAPAADAPADAAAAAADAADAGDAAAGDAAAGEEQQQQQPGDAEAPAGPPAPALPAAKVSGNGLLMLLLQPAAGDATRYSGVQAVKELLQDIEGRALKKLTWGGWRAAPALRSAVRGGGSRGVFAARRLSAAAARPQALPAGDAPAADRQGRKGRPRARGAQAAGAADAAAAGAGQAGLCRCAAAAAASGTWPCTPPASCPAAGAAPPLAAAPGWASARWPNPPTPARPRSRLQEPRFRHASERGGGGGGGRGRGGRRRQPCGGRRCGGSACGSSRSGASCCCPCCPCCCP